MTPAQLEEQARQRRETLESSRKGWTPAAVSRPVFGANVQIPPANARPVNLLTGKDDDEDKFPQAGGKPDAMTEEIKALIKRVPTMVSPKPTTVALEDDVPLSYVGRVTADPVRKAVREALEQMKVGQSFVSPLNEGSTRTLIRKIQRSGRSFTMRIIEKAPKSKRQAKVRVWRVE